jgi:glyoxylase-like metal-dependent hydrolase (beta-lactamase superfamily II)
MKLEFWILNVGQCAHPEYMVRGCGSLKPLVFPVICVLIKHPIHGYLLFDTGYGTRFQAATKRGLNRLYEIVTPTQLDPDGHAALQLGSKLDLREIQTCILSHFHADHFGGLDDFDFAKVYCSKQSYATVPKSDGIRALTAACIPSLLPSNLTEKLSFVEDVSTIPLGEELKPFEVGYDLLGDQSILLVQLDGHAAGMLGLLVEHMNGIKYFFVADAVWGRGEIVENHKPFCAVNFLFSSRRDYDCNVQKLKQLSDHNRSICIIPSHCQDSISAAIDECPHLSFESFPYASD